LPEVSVAVRDTRIVPVRKSLATTQLRVGTPHPVAVKTCRPERPCFVSRPTILRCVDRSSQAAVADVHLDADPLGRQQC